MHPWRMASYQKRWNKLATSIIKACIVFVVVCCLLNVARCHKLAEVICMSQQEVSTCNTHGTDLTLVASQQDDPRCSELTEGQQSEALTKSTTSAGGQDTAARAKACPCKQNYSGLKCDSCTEGFYMKFRHFREDQPPDHQRNRPREDNHLRPATVYRHGNATHRRAHRLFSCQMCNCNLFGSKSLNCDKRNGTCFCIDGYTGPKCDKCSLGYYNSSSLGASDQQHDDRSSSPITRRRQCVECGECFDQWHVKLIELKENGVDLIKRAFQLTSAASASSSTLMMDDGQGTDLLLSRSLDSPGLFDRWANFDDIDEKLRLVGEKVFTNKHNGDKLNLLVSEINNLNMDYDRTVNNLTNLDAISDHLETRIIKLNYHLGLVSSLIGDKLNKMVAKFAQDQIAAQGDLPRGAFRLIQKYSNISLAIKELSIKFQSESRENLKTLNDKLERELASLNVSYSTMQEIGSKLLNESMVAVGLDDVSFLSVPSWNFAHQHLEKPHKLDQSVALTLLQQDLDSRAQAYLCNRTTNEEELKKLEVSILEVVNVFDTTESMLSQFHSSWLNVLNSTGFEIQNIEPWTIYADLENSSRSLRTRSESFEARLKRLETAANELTDDKAIANHTNNILIIRNLTQEINATLANKSTKWNDFESAHRGELLQLNSLKKRAAALASDGSMLNKSIDTASEKDQEASRLQGATRLTLDGMSEDIANSFKQLEADNKSLNHSAHLIEGNQSLIIALKSKYLGAKTKLIEREIIHNHQANRIKRHIEDSSAEQSSLLSDLTRGSSELSGLISALNGSMQEQNRTLLTERESKLQNKYRAQKLVKGIEQLVGELLLMVSKTDKLAGDFVENERALMSQNNTMHLLQDELDSLTTELESGVSNCKQQPPFVA